MSEGPGPRKGADAYRTIGEVAEELHVPQHVLRFWETRFPDVKPLKRAGGRRFYRPEDVALLRAVQTLLYADGYTVKGVQRLLAEFGARHVAESLARSTRTVIGRGGDGESPPRDPSSADRPGREPRADPAPEDAARRGGAPGLPRPAETGDAMERLRAALDHLSECRRLLSSVETSRR